MRAVGSNLSTVLLLVMYVMAGLELVCFGNASGGAPTSQALLLITTASEGELSPCG